MNKRSCYPNHLEKIDTPAPQAARFLARGYGSPKRDPLVVGLAGDSLFLIADYNTTPTEEYVKREFAV